MSNTSERAYGAAAVISAVERVGRTLGRVDAAAGTAPDGVAGSPDLVGLHISFTSPAFCAGCLIARHLDNYTRTRTELNLGSTSMAVDDSARR